MGVGVKSVGEPHMVLTGTGTSVGVPVVGCDCEVCTSGNVRNRRLRSGVFVSAPEGEFCIDAGPELRLQLLGVGASLIEAVVFTHAHADHLMGLDDVRIFAFRKERRLLEAAREIGETQGAAYDDGAARPSVDSSVQLYCETAVEESIRQIFYYAFQDPATLSHPFSAPRLAFRKIEPGHSFSLLGLTLLPIRLLHGVTPVLGFRIGDVAFCTDVSEIPEESLKQLRGLDTLVIDALRMRPHPTHLSVRQAIEYAGILKPRRTILTHMSHELDYDQLRRDLPAGIEPGYDGLKIPLV